MPLVRDARALVNRLVDERRVREARDERGERAIGAGKVALRERSLCSMVEALGGGRHDDGLRLRGRDDGMACAGSGATTVGAVATTGFGAR